MIPARSFEGQRGVFGLARSGLAAARALKAGGAEVAAWDENPARARGRGGGRLYAGRPRDADWSELCGAGAFARRAADPSGAALDGEEGQSGRRRDHRRHRALRPHHQRRAAAPAAEGGRHHRHQRQVDHHGADRPHADRRRPRRRASAATSGLACSGLEDMHGGAVYVFELSSYQLDLTPSLKPDVAILLNITARPPDRHGDMEGYVAAKRRVLVNQADGDTAVIGVDDAWCQRICTEITAANRRTIWPISRPAGDGPRRLCAAGRAL